MCYAPVECDVYACAKVQPSRVCSSKTKAYKQLKYEPALPSYAYIHSQGVAANPRSRTHREITV